MFTCFGCPDDGARTSTTTRTHYRAVTLAPSALAAPRPSRHRVTWAALESFLLNTFTPQDGIAISVFNDQFRTLPGAGDGTHCAAESLVSFAEVQPSGNTRLYDSIADAMTHFRQIGDWRRAWVLVVITDGEDNRSRQHTARSIGNHVRREFTNLNSLSSNPENACYVFVVGVGLSDSGARALQQMVQGDDSANFLVINVANFGLLQACMTAISLRVTTGMQVDIARLISDDGVRAEMMALSRYNRVQQVPIDYYFLLDCSASMTSRA